MGEEKRGSISMGDNNPYLHPPCYGYQDAELQDVSWVLLDLNAYIADRQNSTSACAAMPMSNGETTIRVTLCPAPAPLVSYICVWCPGLSTTKMLAMGPTIEAAESDLLLLRVTVSRNKAGFFVYKANGGPNGVPSLRPIQIPGSCLTHRYTVALLGHRDITPLPSHGEDDVAVDPHGEGEGAGLVALRSHGGGSGGIPYFDGEVVRFRPPVDDAGHYYVAAINIDRCSSQSTQFSFLLFDSKGETWSSTPFSLGGDLPLHITTKSIALRQDGLLGFVDPLRGILICDVLCPETQRYLPLPPEAIRREDYGGDPLLFRDVAVVGGKRLTLVELRYIVRPGSNLSPLWTWEVSTWSRPVTPGWEQNWQLDYKVQSGDISVDMNTDNVSLLPKVKDNLGELRPSLERLYTALPVLSLSNKGVVYIMGKVGRAEDKALVLSLNMIRRKLEGVAMFDAERMVGVPFSYTCIQSRIPEYLNPGLKRRQKRPARFRGAEHGESCQGPQGSKSSASNLHPVTTPPAMSTQGSRATAIGLVIMLLSVSADLHSDGFGLLLCFMGVLVGSGVCMADGPAPIVPVVCGCARALAEFVHHNTAVVGLLIASCAVTMLVSSQAHPVLCFATFALLSLGVFLIIGVRPAPARGLPDHRSSW